MPNDDDLNQFPSPISTTDQPPSDSIDESGEPVLTDPIAPNLSDPITPPSPASDEPGPTPKPPLPSDKKSQPTLPLTPATPPKSKSSSSTPIFVLFTIVTLISAVIATTLYFRNQDLQNQIIDITAVLDNQKLTDSSPTVTPEVFPSIPVSPEATPSSTIDVFPQLNQVIDLAKQSYPDSQLILITVDNPHLPDNSLVKYWFRQSLNAQKYLYLSPNPTGFDLTDQQVYVSPDNNIPSLNQRVETKSLGSDLDATLSLTHSLCPDVDKCQQASAIKAQFIESPTSTIWQITYQIQNDPDPIVIQINSATNQVLYNSSK